MRYIYLVKYDSWGEWVRAFSSFELAVKDIIHFVRNKNNDGFEGLNLAAIQNNWKHLAEKFGYSSWEEGLLHCPYENIGLYLDCIFDLEKKEIDPYE